MKSTLERINNHFLVTWFKQSDILIAIFIIVIIGMLIIPIPSIFLDIFIVTNIALSLGLLLIVIYINKAFEFTVFPTLLLIMTLFRLAVNISSTRLILFNGKDFDTEIILAFGEFVIQNNYVVGAIIFIILIAVQFIVIIKGATRVSEVAARFTLDAMPGKQMSVDSDLANGLITEKEALSRRKELRKEVDFYGAMDGSSKFVQGDVRVGLIITFINLIGGMIIGVFNQNMTVSQAFDVFFLLTVGDGLSAQIPSLLLSTATGIIVTRSVSEKSLGQDISEQIRLNPKAIIITGSFLLLLSLLPGFPKLVLIVIGSLILGYGFFINQELEKVNKDKLEEQNSKPEEDLKDIKSLGTLIQIEPIEIELGYNLIPFVDPSQGGDILDRIKMIRRNFALEMGLPIPPIRIRDNLKLESEEYNIKIKGVVYDSGILKVKKLLAIPSLDVTEEIHGDEGFEPAFKTKAKWIYPEMRQEAERKGYSVVDTVSIISTHLMEVIKNNAADLLGRQEIKELLDTLKDKYPVIIDEALKIVNIGKIQKVLHHLLHEQVSIRNMIAILEVLTDYGDKVLKLEFLVNLVRERLARQICAQYQTENNILKIYTLSTELEELLENSLEENEVGYGSNLDLEMINKVLVAFAKGYRSASGLGYLFVVAVPRNVRFLVKSILQNKLPNTGILSYNELSSQFKIEKIGIIQLNDE